MKRLMPSNRQKVPQGRYFINRRCSDSATYGLRTRAVCTHYHPKSRRDDTLLTVGVAIAQPAETAGQTRIDRPSSEMSK